MRRIWALSLAGQTRYPSVSSDKTDEKFRVLAGNATFASQNCGHGNAFECPNNRNHQRCYKGRERDRRLGEVWALASGPYMRVDIRFTR